ncbi:MAG: Rne/Rng family ribonuclease [Armatimonadetes bacterium]|nr:Rne/Rng family ribonuclease [Armatimonadota bacterium]
MYKEILITRDEREGRAAVLEDGVLSELLIAREERQVGSIFKGRVANVLPGMNAAFVDIGLERNAFLCADDAVAHLGEEASEHLKRELSIKDILRVNEEALVQVVKEAVGTKGARVTTYLTLPGRYLVLIPSAQYVGVSRRVEDESERIRLRNLVEKIRPEGMGLIVRTSSTGRTREDLERELDFLVRSWQKIQKMSRRRKAPACVHQELALVDKILRDVLTPDVDRLIIDNPEEYAKIIEVLEATAPGMVRRVHLYDDPRPLFDLHGIEQEIQQALARKVWLESGGYLIIDRTEALWVVDVNTGKYTGRTHNLADTILRTNLEAVEEICRQLRLRDIGGIIVIDFIDMESASDRRKLLTKLVEELKKDRTRTHLVGMTELGLVQLTRKREGKDLDLVLREDCPYCAGLGRVFSASTMALRVRREVLSLACDSQIEAILLRLNPAVAIEMVGREGAELEALEAETGKAILFRAEETFHREQFEVKTGRKKELTRSLQVLSKGRKERVLIFNTFSPESKSALAVIDGNLVEVLSAGDRVGQLARVRVVETNGVISKAELC